MRKVIDVLMEAMDIELLEVVSLTTREPRSGEVEGQDYFFIVKEDFEARKAAGELAEWAEYDGNSYGSTRQEVEDKANTSATYVIAERHGMTQFAENYPEAITIFLYCSYADARQRMIDQRGDVAKAEKRLTLYSDEIAGMIGFDYVVRNQEGKQELTANVIASIIICHLADRGLQD